MGRGRPHGARRAPEGSQALGRGLPKRSAGRPPETVLYTPGPEGVGSESVFCRAFCHPSGALRLRETYRGPPLRLRSGSTPGQVLTTPAGPDKPLDIARASPNTPFCLPKTLLHVWGTNNV